MEAAKGLEAKSINSWFSRRMHCTWGTFLCNARSNNMLIIPVLVLDSLHSSKSAQSIFSFYFLFLALNEAEPESGHIYANRKAPRRDFSYVISVSFCFIKQFIINRRRTKSNTSCIYLFIILHRTAYFMQLNIFELKRNYY